VTKYPKNNPMSKFKSTFKILGFVIFLSADLYAQRYNKTPIAINDIKKGISDFEYLRAIFLEKGTQV
jgi:hypothetical protein